MKQLRDYQKQSIWHTLQCLEHNELRIYNTMPTGVGKSVIAAALAAHRLQEGRVLVLIHRQDIALQLAKAFQDVEADVGLVMQGHRDLQAAIVVATPQSLTPSLVAELLSAHARPIATIIIDEAHHAVKGSSYERIIETIEEAQGQGKIPVIGYTATPYRSDKQSMLSLLPTCAFARDIPDMVREGCLAPLVWEPLRVNIDLSQVIVRSQAEEEDYDQQALSFHLARSAISEAIARQVATRLEHRLTLVFAASVEHAEQLAAAFRQLGLAARAVSGHQRRAEREQIFEAWRTGVLQIVCNCSLLTEGFDFPAVAALVIARPTRSPSFYMQMLGRGTRPAPGKQDCLVLDVMGNHPDTSHQVVLPQIMGDVQAARGATSAPRKTGDPDLKQFLGAEVTTSLSLLDPIGQSYYWWNPYRLGRFEGYFATVDRYRTAIIERDPAGSGLYRSRLHTKMPGEPVVDTWIAYHYLPLRQQVALVHEATDAWSSRVLGGKDAPWLSEPATERQLQVLRRRYPKVAQRAKANGWTKRKVSTILTFLSLRYTLLHPPAVEEGTNDGA